MKTTRLVTNTRGGGLPVSVEALVVAAVVDFDDG